nr:hypothetical protein [Methylobacterium sp. ZNC0032]
MVDFKAQIQRGLRAHEQANSDKAEIKAVFKELSQQLSEATSEQVTLFISEESDFLTAIQNFGKIVRTDTKKYGIYVQNGQNPSSPSHKIAGWEPSKTGYPCKLSFNGDKFECHDRKSLEEALGRLLASSETGRMIVRAMEYRSGDASEGDEPTS